MTLPLALIAPAFAVLFGFLFAGLLCAAWFWALMDCLQSRFKGSDKLVWAVVLLLAPCGSLLMGLVIRRAGLGLLGLMFAAFVSSLLYFSVGRGQKIPPGEPGPR
jgi:hypothetical protein